jgi:excisionase family DNA binding protein
MGMEELLTTAEAARVLRIRSDSIVRKIKRGEIPAVKVGKQWLIRQSAIEALVQPSAPQGE